VSESVCNYLFKHARGLEGKDASGVDSGDIEGSKRGHFLNKTTKLQQQNWIGSK